MNDDAVEPERVGTPRVEDPATDDKAADDGTADGSDDSTADQPPWEGSSPFNHPPAFLLPDHPEAVPTSQVWRAHEAGDEYEEHFEPPPVAPLPVGDLQFWAIIAGMCGGPLLLLYLILFDRNAGSHWILASIAMSVGGFALLVARLPRDRDDNDDGVRL